MRENGDGSLQTGGALAVGDKKVLCGAELKEESEQIILSLSSGWGGLKRRISLLTSILAWVFPTSPRLCPAASP